ncbi:MAG: DUF2190 domain-containing protein [Acetobacteraceae bacterium]|nr:DUF2190 domain-containing protein [Acetobacteraceae bacterium]
MSNVQLFKNFTAGGAIAAFRCVRLSAAETVVQATAATDAIIGVVQDVAPASGERVDVAVSGIAFAEAQGAVGLGDLVTAQGVGRVQTASPAAGVNNRVIGVALEASTATGDIIRILLSPGSVQG